ncbi:MAG: CHASE3 domain-containing protein [Pseudomonadota bacterium]|uniref:CHASE3 domain-containing protein n=1 Tax=Rhizorhabdus phycosphaerae TaxID=2711156 RepID=UPI0013EC085D|nr:CHASE3 domain-containing protein [Rhizorhabdus phycosphaerae]
MAHSPRRLPYLLLGGLIVAIIAAASAIYLTRAQSRAGGWAAHSLRVEVLLTGMADRMRAIESEHRGYLLVGAPALRERVAQLSARIEPALDQIEREVSDNPRQIRNVATLRAAVRAKLSFAKDGIGAFDRGRRMEAVAAVASGEGHVRIQRVIDIINRMLAEEERLLAERRAQTEQLVMSLGLVLVATVILVLIVAAALIRDSNARERELLTERDRALAAEQAMRVQVEAREKAEAQILHMQKLESIGQLTGGIAHDFNNMLAIVIGSLDLAKRRIGGDTDRLIRYIDNAHEGAQRAASLTARLLAFSRQQPLAPLTIDTNRLVAGMSEMLKRTIGEQYMIETVLAGGLWRCLADPSQLENAIVNLVVNARDAMADGGKVTIETANAYLDDEYARIHPEVRPGQYVMVGVTDTGSGMSPDVLKRAFDPFFTTKAVGKGTGLGLSQIFGFMKQTGGHAAIYSEPGQGTTVRLYLPRSQDPLQDANGRYILDSDEAPRAKQGEAILVVEDEQRVRHFSVDALRDLGYSVISAASAAEAIRTLEEQPVIDMLFTDIVMPEMNGRELAEKVLKMRPGIKILYTTGYTRNAVVHNGMLDAGVAFLSKPFTLMQLALKVRQVLDGGGFNRPV